jgi:hypothetical protein
VKRQSRQNVVLFGAAAALAAALLFVNAPNAAGQTAALRVAAEVECGRCELRLGTPLHLRGEHELGSLSATAQGVLRAPDGGFVVLFNEVATGLARFGPDGRQLASPLGRAGEGPGEFRFITRIERTGPRVHAYDARLARLTTFDLASGELVGTVRLPNHFSVLPLGDSLFVLSGDTRTPEGAGLPLHVYSRAGERVRSFGTDRPLPATASSWLVSRRLAPAGAGEFWAARANEFRIERWNARGELRRVLTAERSAFQPWQEVRNRTRDEPPRANLTDIATDAQGLLWVLYHVPNPDWRRALSADNTSHGVPELIPGRRYLDAVLEIIDPVNGRLLARHELSSQGWKLVEAGLLYRSWEDENYLPRTVLLPVEFIRR